MNDQNGGVFFLGGGDDIPEELKAILQKMLGKALHTSNVHDDVADQINPSAEQYALVPGDRVIVGNETDGGDGLSVAEGEFTLAELLDPSAYADEFPDWEERLYNGRMFGRWFAPYQLEGDLGWFPRIQLVKLPEQWMWDRIMSWIRGEERPNFYDHEPWMTQRLNEVCEAVSVANDCSAPRPLPCGDCGALTTLVKAEVLSKYGLGVGFFSHPDRDPTGLYQMTNVTEETVRSASLYCMTCKAEAPVDLDEITIYMDRDSMNQM